MLPAARPRGSAAPGVGGGAAFPGGRRGCSDPSASALGSSGRRWAGRCPGPAVPASSAMCFRTSSSGTNFTCRAPLPFPSGWLMAGTPQAPPAQPRGAPPSPTARGRCRNARRAAGTVGNVLRLTAPPSRGPGPRGPRFEPRAPARCAAGSTRAPGRPLRRQQKAEAGSRARQRATPLPEGQRGGH